MLQAKLLLIGGLPEVLQLLVGLGAASRSKQQASQRQNVVEPPKRLGPGALISIARQLGPNLARTGSSLSEASIKATLFQDHADNTHTKVSPKITTQNISYISE